MPPTPGSASTSRVPLRDASRGTEGDANNVVHLIGADASAEGGPSTGDADGAPDDEPPRPPSTTGAKPSLKRVK